MGEFMVIRGVSPLYDGRWYDRTLMPIVCPPTAGARLAGGGHLHLQPTGEVELRPGDGAQGAVYSPVPCSQVEECPDG